MNTYNQQLGKEFVEAVQKGQMDLFIERMNKDLQARPSSFLSWLFVSRAYETKGDIENAANSYASFGHFGSPATN